MPILMYESAIENKVSEYALSKGCLSLKLNVHGRIGWPDRLYLYKGRTLFIEFKRPNEKPRKAQEYVHARIRQHGFRVEVVDNDARGREVVDEFTQDRPHLSGVHESGHLDGGQ